MSSLVSAAEAAAYLGLAYQTLQNYRSTGAGPPYYKIGNRILYRTTDLETWLETRKFAPVVMAGE